MIQFNLLPDVKIEYIKTRYRKRLIMFISIVVSATFLAIFTLLFLFVRVNQAKHMDDLTADIDTNKKKIQSIQDLDKILTIQNQLNSLPGLYDQRFTSSRLIDYLTQVTPNQATISDINLDYDATTLSIRGNADSLATANKFTDTLKFTNYKVNNEEGKTDKAFKDVVLQSFALAGAGQNTVTYEIVLSFDPVIFQQVKDAQAGQSQVTLDVPKIISTRSETEKPANLFAPQPSGQGQGQ